MSNVCFVFVATNDRCRAFSKIGLTIYILEIIPRVTCGAKNISQLWISQKYQEGDSVKNSTQISHISWLPHLLHKRRNDNPHPQLRYHSSFLFLRDCIRFCFSSGERRFTDCTILSKFSIAWVLSPLSAISSFSFCPFSSGCYRSTLPQISPSPPSRWTP